MELYLVQHGEATSEDEDPARPLTARGRDEVTRVARAAAHVGVTPAAVYHSGKLRAEQTAEIMASQLQPGRAPTRRDGLAPKDDPAVLAEAVPTLGPRAMLVGHLPHLSRLTARLVAGDPAREVVAFRQAAIVCLVRGDDDRWRVRWILTPELATAHGG